MLYRLSYVRAGVILAGDAARPRAAHNAGKRRVCGRPLRRYRMQDQTTARREDGQTMPEYALILGIITPAIIIALGLLSDGVRARVETVIGFFS
jgi:Flp pilus assembly pilin Flp